MKRPSNAVLFLLAGCAGVPEPKHAPPAAPRVTSEASTLVPGSAAPDFVALGHDGSNVALSALRGRTVILFFYSRDETPSAVREALDFRDAWPTLKQQGIVIVGVSTDAPSAHESFAERLRLPFAVRARRRSARSGRTSVRCSHGVRDRRPADVRDRPQRHRGEGLSAEVHRRARRRGRRVRRELSAR